MQKAPRIRLSAYTLLTCVLGTPVLARAAAPAAVLAGFVRDSRGVPQSGVLVQISGQGRVETTFTDLDGRYHLQGLLPGLYQVRASAALFLPSVRSRLLLHSGGNPLINLTMSGLFDETNWLQPNRRPATVEPDDWKWTLRSPVNRPLLRLVGTDPTGLPHVEHRTRIAAATETGVFGGSSQSVAITAASHDSNGRESVLRLTSAAGSASRERQAVAITARLLSEPQAHSPARLALVSYRILPQVRSGTAALSTLRLVTAERLTLGPFASIEAGSASHLLQVGSASAVVVRPFLAVTVPLSAWQLRYALATSPDSTDLLSAADLDSSTPTAIVDPRGRLRTNATTHQELRLRRQLGHTHLQVALHHDAVHQAALSGLLLGPATAATIPGIALDQSNNVFRTLARGYSSTGASIGATFPITHRVIVDAAVLSASGLRLSPTGSLSPQQFEAMLLAAQGTVPRTGTRCAVSYRWQPAASVTLVAPYEAAAGDGAYLGVHLRQPLSMGHHHRSAALRIDGTNLLREGEHRAALQQNQAILASSLREIRAGLEVTF